MSMLIHGTSQAPYMMIDIFLIYSEMTVRKDDKRTCAAAAIMVVLFYPDISKCKILYFEV